MIGVWPAILVAGVPFAVLQFLVSNFHGPWLVDVVAAIASMASLVLFLSRLASAATRGLPAGRIDTQPRRCGGRTADRAVVRAWTPWVILSVLVFVWGLPQVKAALDALDGPLARAGAAQPGAAACRPSSRTPTPEPAVFAMSWLSATGTGILIAAVVAGLGMGCSRAGPREDLLAARVRLVRSSLLTIAAMLALGFTTRYSGLDATLGLAFAQHGRALSVLRHDARLARRRADRIRHVVERAVRQPAAHHGRAARAEPGPDGRREQLGRRDGQDDRRAEHRRRQHRDTVVRARRRILRYVFWHSLALAALVGLLVLLQAYVSPFSQLVGW